MIKLSNFNAAYQHYAQQKMAFRLLQDQAAVLMRLCENTHPSINNPLEIIQTDIDWLLQQPEASQNYDDLLGGAVNRPGCSRDFLAS